MGAVLVSDKKLGLDNLERLGQGLKDDKLSKALTSLTVSEQEMGNLRKAFFSPYMISESYNDGEYSSAPIGSETLKIICDRIPGIGSFSENLLLHLNSQELKSAGIFPASSTVVFSNAEVTFSRLYDEDLIWYTAGRLLAEQNNGLRSSS